MHSAIGSLNRLPLHAEPRVSPRNPRLHEQQRHPHRELLLLPKPPERPVHSLNLSRASGVRHPSLRRSERLLREPAQLHAVALRRG